jgi:threonyl-tRNA synthetase
LEYARAVQTKLREHGIIAELDDRSEKIGYKIREAEMQKIPYMAIAGEKEVAANTVAIRRHGLGDQGSIDVAVFVAKLLDEIKAKK